VGGSLCGLFQESGCSHKGNGSIQIVLTGDTGQYESVQEGKYSNHVWLKNGKQLYQGWFNPD
jgi:hypothetical protein